MDEPRWVTAKKMNNRLYVSVQIRSSYNYSYGLRSASKNVMSVTVQMDSEPSKTFKYTDPPFGAQTAVDNIVLLMTLQAAYDERARLYEEQITTLKKSLEEKLGLDSDAETTAMVQELGSKYFWRHLRERIAHFLWLDTLTKG